MPGRYLRMLVYFVGIIFQGFCNVILLLYTNFGFASTGPGTESTALAVYSQVEWWTVGAPKLSPHGKREVGISRKKLQE